MTLNPAQAGLLGPTTIFRGTKGQGDNVFPLLGWEELSVPRSDWERSQGWGEKEMGVPMGSLTRPSPGGPGVGG